MHPEARDEDDAGWLISPITAHVGGFTALIDAGPWIGELRSFREGLEQIDRELSGQALLSSIEGWLSLTVQCERNGGLTIKETLQDRCWPRNQLRFALPGLDQTDLPPLVGSLRAAEERWEQGRPAAPP